MKRSSYYLEPGNVKPRAKLNGNDSRCPQCGQYGGKLINDMADLTCLNCGWRIVGYFNEKAPMDSYLLAVLIYNDWHLLPA